jgi:hypothetical protein
MKWIILQRPARRPRIIAAFCEIMQRPGGFFQAAHHINFRRTFYRAIL